MAIRESAQKKRLWNCASTVFELEGEDHCQCALGEGRIWVEKKNAENEILFRHLPLHIALGLCPPENVIEGLLTGYIDGV